MDDGENSPSTTTATSSASTGQESRAVLWPDYNQRSLAFCSAVYLNEAPTRIKRRPHHPSISSLTESPNRTAEKKNDAATSSSSSAAAPVENGILHPPNQPKPPSMQPFPPPSLSRSYDDIVCALEDHQGDGSSSYIVGSPPGGALLSGAVVGGHAAMPVSSTPPGRSGSHPSLISLGSSGGEDSLGVINGVASSPRQIPFSPLVACARRGGVDDDLLPDSDQDAAHQCRCKSPVKGKLRCAHGKIVSTKLMPETIPLEQLRVRDDDNDDNGGTDSGDSRHSDVIRNGDVEEEDAPSQNEVVADDAVATKCTTTMGTPPALMRQNSAEMLQFMGDLCNGDGEDTLTQESGHRLLQQKRPTPASSLILNGDVAAKRHVATNTDDEERVRHASQGSGDGVVVDDVGLGKPAAGVNNPFPFDADGYEEQFRQSVGMSQGDEEAARGRKKEDRKSPHSSRHPTRRKGGTTSSLSPRQNPTSPSRGSDSSSTSDTRRGARSKEKTAAANRRFPAVPNSPEFRSPSALNCAVRFSLFCCSCP